MNKCCTINGFNKQIRHTGTPAQLIWKPIKRPYKPTTSKSIQPTLPPATYRTALRDSPLLVSCSQSCETPIYTTRPFPCRRSSLTPPGRILAGPHPRLGARRLSATHNETLSSTHTPVDMPPFPTSVTTACTKQAVQDDLGWTKAAMFHGYPLPIVSFLEQAAGFTGQTKVAAAFAGTLDLDKGYKSSYTSYTYSGPDNAFVLSICLFQPPIPLLIHFPPVFSFFHSCIIYTDPPLSHSLSREFGRIDF